MKGEKYLPTNPGNLYLYFFSSRWWSICRTNPWLLYLPFYILSFCQRCPGIIAIHDKIEIFQTSKVFFSLFSSKRIKPPTGWIRQWIGLSVEAMKEKNINWTNTSATFDYFSNYFNFTLSRHNCKKKYICENDDDISV